MNALLENNVMNSLSVLLKRRREERLLSLSDAALGSKINQFELSILESEYPVNIKNARLIAVSYVRFLGIDVHSIRELLPNYPCISLSKKEFLKKLHTKSRNNQKYHLKFVIIYFQMMCKVTICLILLYISFNIFCLYRQLQRIHISFPSLLSDNNFSSKVIDHNK